MGVEMVSLSNSTLSLDADPYERTFIMIKPEGVQLGFVGTIIYRFEQRGFKLVAMKLVAPRADHFTEHYKHRTNMGTIQF